MYVPWSYISTSLRWNNPKLLYDLFQQKKKLKTYIYIPQNYTDILFVFSKEMNKYESIKNHIIHNIHKKVTKGKKHENTFTHKSSNNTCNINDGAFVDLVIRARQRHNDRLLRL